MPTTPAPLPRRLGDVFAVAEACAAGVPRARLRAADLDAPYWGVRSVRAVVEAPDDGAPLAEDRSRRAAVLRRVAAFEAVRRRHTFYTGRTAVAIYDRLFDDVVDAVLEVAVFAPARVLRRRGIRCRQIAPELATVREVAGLPVASPASVWAGLADELDERALVRLGDALVRVPRGPGGVRQPEAQLATIAQLAAAAAVRRRRGRAKLERALAQIRVGSMSPLETDVRLDAAAAGLPEPELDVEIRDAAGRLLGIADAVYVDYRVIVEVEGRHHRTSDAQWDRDIEKHAAFVAAGWEVVRLTGRRVRAGRAAETIRGVLRRRGWAG